MLGRRDDGYHVLDSLIAFTELHDTVHVAPADRLILHIEGPFAAALDRGRDGGGGGEDNLVLRAARALMPDGQDTEAAPGARITLTKNLPVASGIGGGSSDAAAALKALNLLWGQGRTDRDLARLGAGLGADVPVCLFGRTASIGGAGEDVVPGPALPPVSLVLVNPGIEVSTPAVFAARSGPWSEAAPLDPAPTDLNAFCAALARRRNDLAGAACGQVPAITDVLAALDRQPGCLLSRLSGSGATCFGLFGDGGAAQKAAQAIQAAHDGWWVRDTKFVD